MSTSALLQRVLGLCLLVGVFLYLDPAQNNILHRLLLPLAAMLGASLVIRNLVAITLACLLLTLLAANLNGDIYQKWLYPAIAVLATLVLLYRLLQRFQASIRTTHKERWKNRNPGTEEPKT